MTSPTDLLNRAVAKDPARPRLTWYDHNSGERVELSGTTLANWVNKTANLLINELGVDPGVSVSIDLPRHWLTAVWYLAVDAVGASTVTTGSHPLAVAVVGPDAIPDAIPDDSEPTTEPLPDADEIVAVSLRPMGAAFDRPLPTMVRDYSVEVRAQPDHFVSSDAGDQQIGERALELARRWSLTPGDRVAAYGEKADWVGELLAPLAADGSVVWFRNLSADRYVEQVAAERVTAGVGEPPIGSLTPQSIRWLP